VKIRIIADLWEVLLEKKIAHGSGRWVEAGEIERGLKEVETG
jgi:hypothetical protein